MSNNFFHDFPRHEPVLIRPLPDFGFGDINNNQQQLVPFGWDQQLIPADAPGIGPLIMDDAEDFEVGRRRRPADRPQYEPDWSSGVISEFGERKKRRTGRNRYNAYRYYPRFARLKYFS